MNWTSGCGQPAAGGHPARHRRVVVVREAAAPGAGPALDVEAARAALADRHDHVRPPRAVAQRRAVRRFDDALVEVAPHDREAHRLHHGRAGRRVEDPPVQLQRRRSGRVRDGQPRAVELERVEAADHHPSRLAEREPDVVEAARTAIERREQRIPPRRERRRPLADRAAELQPCPVQRPVVEPVERPEVGAAALRAVDGRPPQPVAGLRDDALGPLGSARRAEVVLHLGDERVEARQPDQLGSDRGPAGRQGSGQPLFLDGQRRGRVKAAGRGRGHGGEREERDGGEQGEQGGQAHGFPSTAWVTRSSLPPTAPPA